MEFTQNENKENKDNKTVGKKDFLNGSKMKDDSYLSEQVSQVGSYVVQHWRTVALAATVVGAAIAGTYALVSKPARVARKR